MNNRVVITGLGVISPLGNDIKTLWENIVKGESGIDIISRFETDKFDTKIAGEVKDFDPLNYLDKKEARRMDRFTQFALAATDLAVKHSCLDADKVDPNRFGVIIGSGIGGIETLEKQTEILLEKGPKRISPFFVPMMIGNIAAGQISIYHNARGINSTVVTACSSSTTAIGEAYHAIKYGKADVIITGGTEAPITPLALAGFNAMKALSTRNDDPKGASRPFDLDRDGFVMAEGAAILILESYEHAVKRNAPIIAELAGYGLTADAHHITAPAPGGEGGARAMEEAIRDAGLSYKDIDYINAHGTSTPYNDKFESQAIKTVFKEHASKLAVSSTKSMTGHLLGAAGAIEAILTVLAIENDFIPATINLTTKDPECDLDYVPNKGRDAKINIAISNSFGFGGQNSSIIIKRFIK